MKLQGGSIQNKTAADMNARPSTGMKIQEQAHRFTNVTSQSTSTAPHHTGQKESDPKAIQRNQFTGKGAFIAPKTESVSSGVNKGQNNNQVI